MDVKLGLLLGACTASALALLGKQDSLDVRQHTTLRNSHASHQLVKFLIIPDGQLEVPWDNPRLLVVPCSIASQLEDLSSKVLHHRSHVDWGTSSNSLGVVSFPQEPVDAANRELKSSPAGSGLHLGLGLASLAASRHLSKCIKSLLRSVFKLFKL